MIGIQTQAAVFEGWNTQTNPLSYARPHLQKSKLGCLEPYL